jgi:uncharacterized protein
MSNPESGPSFADLPRCGDFDMRIAADGIWFYRGTPINRKPLVKLFSTVLRREEDGEYWLVTPVERGRILVDDAPFTAVEVTAEGKGRDQVLTFRTNLDEFVIADLDHPIRVSHRSGQSGQEDEPRPYILVRPGLEALILRSVYYHLVDLSEIRPIEGLEQLGVWSQGQFFLLGAAAEAVRPETAQ